MGRTKLIRVPIEKDLLLEIEARKRGITKAELLRRYVVLNFIPEIRKKD